MTALAMLSRSFSGPCTNAEETLVSAYWSLVALFLPADLYKDACRENGFT